MSIFKEDCNFVHFSIKVFRSFFFRCCCRHDFVPLMGDRKREFWFDDATESCKCVKCANEREREKLCVCVCVCEREREREREVGLLI